MRTEAGEGGVERRVGGLKTEKRGAREKRDNRIDIQKLLAERMNDNFRNFCERNCTLNNDMKCYRKRFEILA